MSQASSSVKSSSSSNIRFLLLHFNALPRLFLREQLAILARDIAQVTESSLLKSTLPNKNLKNNKTI